jgi:hypothetical protein
MDAAACGLIGGVISAEPPWPEEARDTPAIPEGAFIRKEQPFNPDSEGRNGPPAEASRHRQPERFLTAWALSGAS